MQFAVKKLTRSDLTFFEHQYRRQQAGNQKSINLNADVFVDLIFPLARSAAGGHARQFPIPLSIYGPGLREEPHRVVRKVIAAGDRQKNWRLNGEFVPDPEFDPQRYHNLVAGDFAVIGFDGHGLPSAAFLVLVSKSETSDSALHAYLAAALGNRSMNVLSNEALLSAVETTAPNHPIRELLDIELDEALEEAAVGSAKAAEQLRRRPSPRRMSPEALAQARARAESIGRDGELAVEAWLLGQLKAGALKAVWWIAESNAVNPWDFEVEELDGTQVRIEVKATTGPFNRPLHISQGEVLAAAESSIRTDLYRIYAISDDGAWLQISTDIRSQAKKIASAATSFGAEITPDCYSVIPTYFQNWSAPIRLTGDETDESDLFSSDGQSSQTRLDN